MPDGIQSIMADDIQSLWLWRGLLLSCAFGIFCQTMKQNQILSEIAERLKNGPTAGR